LTDPEGEQSGDGRGPPPKPLSLLSNEEKRDRKRAKDRVAQRKTREKRTALVDTLIEQNEVLAQRVAQLQKENADLRQNFDCLWREASLPQQQQDFLRVQQPEGVEQGALDCYPFCYKGGLSEICDHSRRGLGVGTTGTLKPPYPHSISI